MGNSRIYIKKLIKRYELRVIGTRYSTTFDRKCIGVIINRPALVSYNISCESAGNYPEIVA